MAILMKRNDSLKTELFKKHLPLAHHLAGKFSRRYGANYADLCEETESLLGLVCAQWDLKSKSYGYDPARSKPITFIYRRLNSALLNKFTLTDSGNVPAVSLVKITKLDGKDGDLDIPSKTSWIDSMMKSIGEDAKIVVKTILESPGEIVSDILKTPPNSMDERAQARQAIIRRIKQEHHWHEDRVEDAWDEVSLCL